VGEEKLEFNLSQVTASPSLEDACYLVNVIEKVVSEEMKNPSSPLNLLEACLLATYEKEVDVHLNDEREVCTRMLEMA